MRQISALANVHSTGQFGDYEDKTRFVMELDKSVKLFIEIVDVSLSILPTIPVATTSSSFLNNTSILSPIFKLDLSISLVSKIMLAPDILLIKKGGVSALRVDKDGLLSIKEFASLPFEVTEGGIAYFDNNFYLGLG